MDGRSSICSLQIDKRPFDLLWHLQLPARQSKEAFGTTCHRLTIYGHRFFIRTSFVFYVCFFGELGQSGHFKYK